MDTTDTFDTRSAARKSVGWAAGLGIEWAMLDNISIGFEYMRADFGSQKMEVVDPVATAAADQRRTRLLTRRFINDGIEDLGPRRIDPVTRTVRIDDSVDLFRVKMNVRF